MDPSLQPPDVSFKSKAQRFITQCIRVLHVTRKPDRAEFSMLVKVSGLGIAVIGLLGFFLHLAWTLIGLKPV